MESRCIISHVVSPDEFYGQIGTVKVFDDFTKLEQIIQDFCINRRQLFHSTSNVIQDEVLFFHSSKLNIYVRGKVLHLSSDSRCLVKILDYGGHEDNVTSVLKIDPSVKKFKEIPEFAKQMKLAFVESIGAHWSLESIDAFKKYSHTKIIALPCEPGSYSLVSLIIRNGNSFCDLSEILIQSGLAKRQSGDDVSPIAASISNLSLQHHTVAVQTESEHVIQPPDHFTTPDRPAEVRDSPRKQPTLPVDMSSMEDLLCCHVSSCQCLFCSIHRTIVNNDVLNSETVHIVIEKHRNDNLAPCIPKLRQIILSNGPKMLKSFLLDVLLAVNKLEMKNKRKSSDSSTQARIIEPGKAARNYSYRYSVDELLKIRKLVESLPERKLAGLVNSFVHVIPEDIRRVTNCNSNRITLSSSESGQPSKDDIIIINPHTDRTLASGDNFSIIKTDPRTSTDVQRSLDVIESELSVLAPTTISQFTAAPAESSFMCHSFEENEQGSLECGSDSSEDVCVAINSNAISKNPASALKDPASRPYVPPALRSQQNSTFPGAKPGSPTTGRGRAFINNSRLPTKPGGSFGEPTRYQKTSTPEQSVNGSHEFGMVMYCTFCGSTMHKSSSCPDGTKNLFL